MLPAYTTTKFAVIGLSESLREELAPHRIGVTAVCPGIIDTGIVRASRMRGKQASEASRAEMQRGFARRNYTPERVAENVLRAIQRNRAVAPISPEAWTFYYAKRFAPGRALAQRRTQEASVGGGDARKRLSDGSAARDSANSVARRCSRKRCCSGAPPSHIRCPPGIQCAAGSSQCDHSARASANGAT
jgi:hypothetical protein